MFTSQPFYHEQVRKVIVAFGALFSDIKIIRSNDTGTVTQEVAIPIAFSPKEKWLQRIDGDPNLENNTYTTVPRMGFEIVGYEYDGVRKTNRMAKINCNDSNGTTRRSAYAPTPWNLEVSMYILTKTYEDGLQIIEQILPYFNPEYTLSIKAIPELNLVQDIPIILNSVQVQDEYDGSFEKRRFVTHTLNFTIKAEMFGPVSNQGIINKVIVDFKNQDIVYTVQSPSPETTIVESWIGDL